ncbi:MAG: FAD-binding oxidoreductase [Amaricoccus sp.]
MREIWLSAGCEMFKSRAAAVPGPRRITAVKTSSCRARMPLQDRLAEPSFWSFGRARARATIASEQSEGRDAVIIIGGGLMGTAAAFFLTRRGAKAALIERAPRRPARPPPSRASATSAARAATCRNCPRHRSRARRATSTASSAATSSSAPPATSVIFDAAALADMRAFAAAAPWGLAIDELAPAEIRARFPGLGPDAIAASFSPEDGSANPRLIAPAFAARAAAEGAEIVENCAVTGITARDGFAVEGTAGRFSADVLLNAAGAWGARIAADFGEPVPLAAHGPQMGVTEPLPHRILPVVGVWAREKERSVYLRQVERGNVVFGGGARVPVALDPGHAAVDPALTRSQSRWLLRLCPALASATVIRTWSGCEGYLSDMLPVMGPSGTTPGLFHAFGFCGHGFQLGPAVGDAMAELIATGACQTPLADFDIKRFGLGMDAN